MIPVRKIENNGFTLIELILGLSIFAMISLLLYSTFWGGVKLSERAGSQGEAYHQARWALRLMGEELENMVEYDFSNSYEDKSAFYGADDEIVFINPTQDGLRTIRYRLVSPQDSHMHQVLIGSTYSKNVTVTTAESIADKVLYLVREEKSFVDYLDQDFTNDDEQEVIAVNVAKDGLNLSYGERVTNELSADEMEWTTEWDDASLPTAVRIEIKFEIPKQEEALSMNKEVYIPQSPG